MTDDEATALVNEIADAIDGLLKRWEDATTMTDEEYRDFREYNRGLLDAHKVVVNAFRDRGIEVTEE